jgi:hypothetical protein
MSSTAIEFLTKGDTVVSPIVDQWPLMSSPAPMLAIFGIYLLLVLKVLPRHMETRKPMNLTNFTRVYNISQVFVCAWFVKWSIQWGFRFSTTWQCLGDVNDKERLLEYNSAQWWFLLLRLAELVETVVFALRKKQNQVSTLHVYHHISTASLVWAFLKYSNSELYLDLIFFSNS